MVPSSESRSPGIDQEELDDSKECELRSGESEVRGGAGGNSQTMKPSSESRGHRASTGKSWTTARGAGRARAIAEARGGTNRSSQKIIASRESENRRTITSRNWATASMAG